MPGAARSRKLSEGAVNVYLGLRREFHRSRGQVRPGVEYLRKPYDRERRAIMVRRGLGVPAKIIEDPNEPELDTVSRHINKACPTKNINPARTIDWI